MDAINSIDVDFLPRDEEPLYLVGGTVRDLLCGQKPVDIDLTTEGQLDRMAKKIATTLDGKIIHLGNHEVPVLRVVSPKHIIDISPLSGGCIEEDLMRRDFTINAMAYDLNKSKLVDCLEGQKDLKQKKIRMVSNHIFKSDPARLIRAFRMAASFGFSMTNETKTEISRQRGLISTVSAERIWPELVKLLKASHATHIVREMAELGLLISLIPEIEPSIGCRQNHHHQHDVFEHSLRGLKQVDRLLSNDDRCASTFTPLLTSGNLSDVLYLLKYSALLHDIGKPAVRTVDEDGMVHFPGHATKSAKIASAISARLQLSNQEKRISDAIIRHHIRPLFLFLASQKGTLGSRGIIRFFKHCGDLTPAVLAHAIADIRAKKESMENRDERFIVFCHHLAVLYDDALTKQNTTARLLNGHDLMSELGLQPSPTLKLLLNRVDEFRLAGLMTTRDQALKWVESYLNKHRT